MVRTVLNEFNKGGLLNQTGRILSEQPELFSSTYDNLEKVCKGYTTNEIVERFVSDFTMEACKKLTTTEIMQKWIAEEERNIMDVIITVEDIANLSTSKGIFDREPAIVEIEKETKEKLNGLELKVEIDNGGYFLSVTTYKVRFYEDFSKTYCKIDQVSEDGYIIMYIYKEEWQGFEHLINKLRKRGLRFISECIETNLS